jgi:hypothetical protein
VGLVNSVERLGHEDRTPTHGYAATREAEARNAIVRRR